MKIVYFITSSCLGGAQTHVLDLINSFHEIHEIHLVTSVSGFLTESAKKQNVKIHFLSNLTRDISVINDFIVFKEFFDLVKKISPDIIHAHSSKAGAIGRVVGKLCKIPVVFTAHGWGFTDGVTLIRKFILFSVEYLLSFLSSKTICVSASDYKKGLNLGGCNQETMVNINCGISDIKPVENDLEKQPPKFIMVARFNEQKDQLTLLKAISLLQDLEFSVELVGSGSSLNTCKEFVKANKLDSKIVFLEDRNDVPELLAKSQAFILITKYEGLPISIMEAMRVGLPIIATNTDGVPEAVEDGINGFLVEKSNVREISEKVKYLIQNPNIRKRMGNNSRIKFRNNFCIDRMTLSIEELYLNVLKPKL
jgi:glycosyltransferase involved in cell wall biosynthesis